MTTMDTPTPLFYYYHALLSGLVLMIKATNNSFLDGQKVNIFVLLNQNT